MRIRFVETWEWDTVEVGQAETPWKLAEERFVSYFHDPHRGRRLYEQVEEKYGCFALNAVDWAIAMNTVIATLNALSEDALESEVIAAFELGTARQAEISRRGSCNTS